MSLPALLSIDGQNCDQNGGRETERKCASTSSLVSVQNLAFLQFNHGSLVAEADLEDVSMGCGLAEMTPTPKFFMRTVLSVSEKFGDERKRPPT